MYHHSITQEEINLVEERLTFIDEEGQPKQNETAQQWYERNVALVGEAEAIRRFKNKANNQRLGK
mgnify:CR=1 FL=1